MKALLQRVSSASVTVDGREISRIGRGLLIFVGVVNEDGESEVAKLAKKCSELRIFTDSDGKMNLSVMDVKGEALVVSQFTLAANCTKGRRPSFERAANPDIANGFYEKFCDALAALGVPVKRGIFAAHMDAALVNDGPVTIMLDTNEL